MNILITGGTGFIGTALCTRLLEDKHRIVILSRQKQPDAAPFRYISSLDQLEQTHPFEIVINLAGEPIANQRWSTRQKQIISDSRINTTQHLINYFEKLEHKPILFISGSAIGYYGIDKTDDAIDEQSGHDDSFSSQLCQQWEAVAMQAQALGIRTCLLRTGIVLGAGGGALAKVLPLFKLGLGGKIGSGTQWMSWIHMQDLIGIIMHCIKHPSVRGAINGTAPKPVTNLEFTQTLARTLRRPAFLPFPEGVLKFLMGEMGEELLLSGKKIVPNKALKSDYQFQYSALDAALDSIL